VLVCDFLAPSPNVPDALPCATLLFQHNVEALIWQRHWQVARNPVTKAYLWDQWRKMRRFEAAECRRYDHVVAVSAADREIMERDYGLQGRVSDVPTGVDTDFFRPVGDVPVESSSLVFTGSMDWLPNPDAIRYFAAEILPRIRSQVPEVSLTVVGRHPTPDLVELARREPAIKLTGFVNDVRPYMERAAVYVVPLRIGGGTRLKVYEAMAMEKPIVSTTIGAEGLPVTDGEELLLADDPQHFADAVVALLRDPARARAIGRAGAERVRRDFGWAGVATRFTEACERAVGTAAAV
jgi:glycosyltransferase involved in cell wall biosynthesis